MIDLSGNVEFLHWTLTARENRKKLWNMDFAKETVTLPGTTDSNRKE